MINRNASKIKAVVVKVIVIAVGNGKVEQHVKDVMIVAAMEIGIILKPLVVVLAAEAAEVLLQIVI